LTAAEALREQGFTGIIVLVGAEPYPPYDRPPLSKRVVAGRLEAKDTGLPQPADLDAEWLLAVAATSLDRRARTVTLANGDVLGYDKLLIATGSRARLWPRPAEANLDGVFVVRTRDDAGALRARLATRPPRVLVIGAGLVGSEMASVRRGRGLDVTVVERSSAPLAGVLGCPAGIAAERLLRRHGVDLRTHTSVLTLEGDSRGRLRHARLSDGDILGLSSRADQVALMQGSVANGAFVAAYGRAGRVVGALAVNTPRTLDLYAASINSRAASHPTCMSSTLGVPSGCWTLRYRPTGRLPTKPPATPNPANRLRSVSHQSDGMKVMSGDSEINPAPTTTA